LIENRYLIRFFIQGILFIKNLFINTHISEKIYESLLILIFPNFRPDKER